MAWVTHQVVVVETIFLSLFSELLRHLQVASQTHVWSENSMKQRVLRRQHERAEHESHWCKKSSLNDTRKAHKFRRQQTCNIRSKCAIIKVNYGGRGTSFWDMTGCSLNCFELCFSSLRKFRKFMIFAASFRAFPTPFASDWKEIASNWRPTTSITCVGESIKGKFWVSIESGKFAE